MNYVYLIKNMVDGTYKIGVSKHPNTRLNQNQTGSSGKLVLIETYQSDLAYKIETALHNQYQSSREEGEWFSISLTEELGFIDGCKKIETNIRFLQESGNVFA